MENFVLYHEIYKRDGMTMYKGRKKGTITYVAISCIDKGERIKVTNHVRLVYELEHEHVVKFYEWYETSNHLWLVTELCVGGTLAQVLQQDVRLPESAVRIFGCHLVRGIHHMHGNELVYANWHPSKIILSGDGSLKFFDFSDSRKINEDPKDLMQRFFSTLNLEQSEIEDLLACRPVCEYSAPEVLEGSAPGPAADIWGLGCIMYEMFAGTPPFKESDPQQLTHQILHTPLIVARAHSTSLHLNDLLQRMLTKQPETRISLSDVCSHPFWDGSLDDIVGPCSAFVGNTARSAHGPVSIADDTSTSTIDDVSFTLHLGSRPADVIRDVKDSTQAPDQRASSVSHNSVVTDQQLLMAIVTASSKDNCVRTPHEEYVKMTKDGRLKYDPKQLPVAPLSLVKWRALRKADKDKHLKQLETLFKNGEKGPPSQRKLHLVNYLSQLCIAPEVSNLVMESGLAMDLCRQLKGNSNQEWLSRVSQALAIVCHYSTVPAPDGEIVAVLADLLRDQFRCVRVKLPCVCALGESLARLAQSTNDSLNADSGSEGLVAVGLAINLLNRCLHRTEEVAVSVAAARAIEAILRHEQSPVTRLLASGETAQQLYTGYKHATIDSLKTTAISGLCRLTRIDPGLFGGLLEKVGALAILDQLHLGLVAVQEAVLEMVLVAVLAARDSPLVSPIRKLTQEPGFLSASMRLLETPAATVRAKTLLLVMLVCQADLALLRTATDHRLVLYVEREQKRAAQDRSPTTDHCLAMVTSFLTTTAVPAVLRHCTEALDAVHGRKHPSSVHTRSLRRWMPLLDSVASIVSSASLRTAVLATPQFAQCLAAILTHAHRIDTGQTNIGGPDTAPLLLTHTMTLVEAACHSTDVATLVHWILPPLASLCQSATNADARIIGLKLCADLVHLIESDSTDISLDPVTEALEKSLLPHMAKFVSDPDPSAVYMLRLLRHYLSLAPDSCIQACRQHSLAHVIVQVLVDHQSRVMAATVLESLLLVSAISLANGDLIRDLVLDVDLVPVLCDIVLDIGDHYHKDDKCQQSPKTVEFFLAGIETLYGLSRLVSDVVRMALQSKRKADDDQVTARLTGEAEELLGAGKPLTETVDLLIVTVGSEGPDGEIGEAATRLLNQVVSLYGGQQIEHGVREANLESLCAAIGGGSVKQRRTLLRILKRLLAASGGGGGGGGEGSVACVRQMVAMMTQGDVDPACQSLAAEVGRLVADRP